MGLLDDRNGRACTGTLVGPRSVLTAASCFPGVARGCISRRGVSASFTFRLPGAHRDHEFPVRDIATYPLAYPLSAENACDASCELGDDPSVVDLRRGRDVALVYLDDESDGTSPADVAAPLRVVTEVDVDDASPAPAPRHVYVDWERDFREGSRIRPTLVGYGEDARSAARLPYVQEAAGRFDLGDLWNRGCEQVPRCGRAPSLRNRCPPLPLQAGPDFFQDAVLRVLDAPREPWLSTFLSGSSGAPLLITRGAPEGSLSTFHGDEESVLGVLSDAETARDGERVAAYVAPTFWRETGSWLSARLRDFDGDCKVNEEDPRPTDAQTIAVCTIAPNSQAKWQRSFLEDEIASPAPRPEPWLHREGLAAVTSAELTVELFRVGVGDVVYRATQPAEARDSWTAWTPVLTAAGLRGELSAFQLGDATGLVALTESRELRFFEIARSGASRELQAPAPVPGGFTSAPSAVATPVSLSGEPQGVDLFVRGSGAELLRFRYRGGAWTAPQTLGLSLTSAPSAVAFGDEGIEVFARSRDFHLLAWRVTSEAAPRAAPEELGAVEGAPVAASFGSARVDLLARGADGILRHRTRQDATWSDWQPINAVVGSGVALTSPAAGTLKAYTTTDLSELITFVYPNPTAPP